MAILKKSALRFLAVAVLLLTVSLLVITPTLAYSLSGKTWPTVNPLYFRQNDGMDSDSLTAFAYAAYDWTNTSTDVYFIGTTEQDEDVLTGAGYIGDTGWDGVNYLYWAGSTITYSYSILNTYYTASYSANKRRSVASHEFGHALGLNDVASGSQALMNDNTPSRYDTLGIYLPQTDDINGVNAMY